MKELYQLVAIYDGKEEIVPLNSNNKNSKCVLCYIDSITLGLKNKDELISMLIKEGKLSTLNADFFIKYSRNGERRLPLLFNDLSFEFAAKKCFLKDDKPYAQYVCSLFQRFIKYLENEKFYKFFMYANEKNKNTYKNGSYLNDELVNNIIIYYNLLKNNENFAQKNEIEKKMLYEIISYKQLRTLCAIFDEYRDFIFSNKNTKNNLNKSLNQETVEELKQQEIQSIYNKDGMDEVYTYTDLDEMDLYGVKIKV